ncbi:hypothetical protein ABFS82_07G098800 [Erythranthe guttata]
MGTNKYVQQSQNVVEIRTEKLLNRLCVLLFHVDKQIDKVLLQGRFLPKKLSQWPLEARALKCQVSDLIEKQRNRKGDLQIREELVAVGIEMINQLKRCPFKDEYMYDKPIPEIVQKHEKYEPDLDIYHKTKTRQYTSGSKFYNVVEKRMHPPRKPTKQIAARKNNLMDYLSIGQSYSDESNLSTVPQATDAILGLTYSVNKSLLRQKVSDAVSVAKPLRSEPISIPESTVSGVVLEKASSFTRNKMILPTPNADSLSGAHNLNHAEQKQTDEMPKFVDIKEENLHRSCSQEIKKVYGDFFPKDEHYLISTKGNIVNLELDHQTISIGDYPSSSGQNENSSVINLAEQDLCQLPDKPDYPNSCIMFLQKNDRLARIHDSFFQTMPDLLFLDMSDTRIRILPSSLFGLSKLKVLLLRNCLSLDNLPPQIRELANLEVLDLSGSELYDLPDEIGELTLLTHMQLSFYGPDDESEYAHLPPRLVSPGFLSKIEKLETLTISVHPDDHRWVKIAEPILKDIGVFENLSYLQFYFPQVQMFEDFIGRSSSWFKGTLIKFKFVVGRDVKRIASRVPNEIELAFHEERQSLRFVNGNEKVPQVIQNVLARATSFYLDHHMKVKSLSEFGISMFKLLKFCLLRECPKIQSIIGNNSTEGAFPCLEHLSIYYLWELEYICKSPSVKGSFPALTHLTVSTCRKLKFVLWESMLPSLSNLKELVVEECESVEKIVRQEKEKVNTNNNAEMLPELRKLVLQNLPELVTLGNGLCLSEDKLDINGCPKFVLNSRPKEQSVVKQRKFLTSLKAALQFK